MTARPPWALALLVAALVSLAAQTAGALPVFARRYETSCSTCHVQFPKLNAFGEAFRRNGYQYPGGRDADAIAHKPVTLVAEPYREVFPRSFWPSDLPSSLPMAFAIDALVPIFPDSATRPVGENAISFDRLYGRAELLVAARLGKDVTVFGEVNLNSATGVELPRAFLVVSNLLGESVLHLRVGQFEPQLLSFSDYRRVSGPSYLLFTSKIEHSQWDFRFVRGVNLSGTIGGRFGWDAAYVQGVEGSYSGDGIRQVPRDGYAHAYLKVGGLRLDGIERPGAAPPTADATPERSLLLGGFFYGGKHDVDTHNDPSIPPEGDVLYKVGGDLDALFGPFELLLAGAYESHRFDRTAPTSRVQGLAEATVVIFPWLVGGLRGEVEVNQGAFGARLTPMVSVHPRINLKVQVWAQIERDLQGDNLHFKELDIAARYAF